LDIFEYALIIGWLVLLEGLLSVDNALALATMVSVLPEHQQKKALKYGIWGAFIFRTIAVLLAAILIDIWWFKLLGGGYLFYVAIKGLLEKESSASDRTKTKPIPKFWVVVFQVELMDIAFSIDSILAAVAMTDKMVLVIIGGILGIIAMRFAAGVFIKLLKRYPVLKKTAYVLLLPIGAKLIASIWWHPPGWTHWAFFGILFSILAGAILIQRRQQPK
jgi:YkoY family integral membrane protein